MLNVRSAHCLLHGVLPEALQNSSNWPPECVGAACRKLLTGSQLRALPNIGPASAFDGLVGVLFTPRRATVPSNSSGVIMQNRVYRFVVLAAGLMLASA
jgi:hypothetical protein